MRALRQEQNDCSHNVGSRNYMLARAPIKVIIAMGQRIL